MLKKPKSSKLPKISIIIPSYNKVNYIGETLDSIVSQDYPNSEVIIQDGGSTDGTLEIIKEYTQKYHKVIKWVSQKDKGQTDAINKGLQRATGDVITYLNADDVYERGALKAVGEYFANNPNALWLVGKGRLMNEKGREIAQIITCYKNFLLSHYRYTFLLVTNFLMQPSVFLSKKAYKKYGPFTGTDSFVTEYDLWLKIARYIRPHILDTYLSRFRISRENISSTQSENLLAKDEGIVQKYTSNALILFLHKWHNRGRIFTLRFFRRK